MTKKTKWQTSSVCIYFLSSVLLLSAMIPTSVCASIDIYQFENNAQEQQYRKLIDELRCPKCQNQNLASSDSGIAEDLKRKTHQMVKEGKSDTQIRTFMVERYGDFVTYNPPVRPSTYILWYLPPILLLLAIAGWLGWSVSNNKKVISDRKVINDKSNRESGSRVEGRVDNNTTSNSILKPAQLTDAEQTKLDSILNQHNNQQNLHIETDDKKSKAVEK